MKKIFLFVIPLTLILSRPPSLYSQQSYSLPLPPTSGLIASEDVDKEYIRPSVDPYQKNEGCIISIEYVGEWPVKSKGAVDYAARIIEKHFNSDIVINVIANWTNTVPGNRLCYSRPYSIVRNPNPNFMVHY